MGVYHQPVFLREVVGLLTREGERGGDFFDGTLGGGGHAESLLRIREDIRVTGMDQDSDAIQEVAERLKGFGERFQCIPGNFREMEQRLPEGRWDGILFDLGVSSYQLDTPERGFSFMKDGPLDMRMNQSADRSAEEWINQMDEKDLADLFWKWGEERHSRKIARAIVHDRKTRPFRRTGDLAGLIERILGRRGRTHPATKVFQALRIGVNDELGALEQGLISGWRQLKPGGRMVVITFHSIEDRVVKRQFQTWARVEGSGSLLMKKPLVPAEDEIRENSRARSAKLRAIEKK